MTTKIKTTAATALIVSALAGGVAHADMDTARQALSNNDFPAAVEALDEVLAQSPNDAEARFLKGLALARSGDTGGALDFLKKMDTALGGRTDDDILGRLMEDTYRTMFYEPLRQRNIEVPELTGAEIVRHFTHHDINPLRVLRQDMNRLQAIQDVLCPRARDGSGRLTINPSDARQWTAMERMKMDLVRQYEQTDSRTSREMPSAPDLSTI